MRKAELSLEVRKAINFKVTLYYGGGLGDLAHRIYDSYYICRLRSIKEYFPNIKIILQINTTRNMESAKSLFESNPYIDELMVYPEWCMNRDIYVFASNLLGRYKNDFGKFQPDVDNELVFHRVVNRVQELLSFPHIHAISMNEFFALFNLDIMDFEADEPRIHLKPDEEKFGSDLRAELSKDGGKLIGFHPFSMNQERMMNPEMAKPLVSFLLEKGYKVVILGEEREADPKCSENAKEKNMIHSMLNFKGHKNISYHCDNLSIRHKAAIIKNCDYFIANDSGLMHLAWLQKVKTISLFREQTVAEVDRFKRKNGYYWAVASGLPFASYIIYDNTGMFDLMFVEKRIKEFEDIHAEKAVSGS